MEKFSIWKDILWSGDDHGFHYNITQRSPKLITYLNPQAPTQSTPLTMVLHGPAGVGKTTLAKELMLDWVEYIKGLCMENEMIAHQIRKKGKTLQGCMAVLLEYSFKNQITVDKTIIKAAGVSAGKVTFGVPGMAKAKELIRDYYMGGAKA